MKRKAQTCTFLLKHLCLVCCGGLLIASCSKNPNTPRDPNDPGDSTSTTKADTLSNHLMFMDVEKKEGTIPKGPSSTSLKISFKDTIYLTDALVPIKFLHEDTGKNVAGAMVQLYAGGTASIYYFDVTELPDAAENDTVSTILVGIKTEGIVDAGVPPAGGVPSKTTIKIVPYDKNGEMLAEITRPVDISSPNSNAAGACGLVGGSFYWEMSYNMNGFRNQPEKLWGLGGQMIQGCCTNGVSSYTPNCAPENKRSLNFQTFFGWPRERWIFQEDGNYTGISDYLSTTPEPQSSNFCGNGKGLVLEKFKVSFPEGTWFVDASDNLIMRGDVAANSAARPIGKIFSLKCTYLIITQPNGETQDENSLLYKFYMRNYPGQPRWYDPGF